MSILYLLAATGVGALILFFWQAFHRMVLWPKSAQHEIKDEAKTTALKEHFPENGLYMGLDGVLLSTFRKPGVDNLQDAMGAILGRQMLLNLVVALCLAVFTAWLPADLSQRLCAISAAGLAGGVMFHGGQWNWYGFNPTYTVFGIIEITVGWTLVALANLGLAHALA